MHKLAIILLIVLYAVGCSPKLATNVSTEDYTEDVSAFRPEIEPLELEAGDQEDTSPQKKYAQADHPQKPKL